MKTVSLSEAKNRLSELIDRVERAEASSPADQRREVRASFRQLQGLCRHVQLSGDPKTIARESLD